MSDSFFTTRTSADLQFDHINVDTCQTYLEASLRRIAKIEGPLEAARKMQRLADICAGVYVLPIEHWQKATTVEAPAETPRPTRFAAIRRYLTDGSVFAFWLGFVFGCFVKGGR